MSKPEWFGVAVLGGGAVFGFVWGGPFGLIFAAGCLVVGLVLVVASKALGTELTSSPSQAPGKTKTPILVLVKEIHARPHRSGKFREIREPHQTDLQFEIFAHCWLVNDTDEELGIVSWQLSLTKPGGNPTVLERVSGDLENWRLGRLRDEMDSWGVRYLQAAQEPISELSTTEPLQGGETRQGWVHLRAQNITPAEMRSATIELQVIDSHLFTHLGAANGPHQLPGRVWPFRPEDGKTSEVPTAAPPDAQSRLVG